MEKHFPEDFIQRNGGCFAGAAPTRQDGFTLVEVLIAITLFAVGILGVTSMQIMAMRTNAKANQRTEAYALASDRMERLIDLPYADIAGPVDENDDPAPVQVDEYTIFWTVADDTPIVDTKTITVTVQWQYMGHQQARLTRIKGAS